MNSVAGAGTDSGSSDMPEFASGTLTVWGDVRFSTDALVRAHIHGDIQATRKLVVAVTAEVSGRIHGFDVCLEGKVSGGVEAEDQVWLKRGGWLRQRCVARALRIERGADFQGELRVGAVTS